jgi:hypothetical protein
MLSAILLCRHGYKADLMTMKLPEGLTDTSCGPSHQVGCKTPRGLVTCRFGDAIQRAEECQCKCGSQVAPARVPRPITPNGRRFCVQGTLDWWQVLLRLHLAIRHTSPY